MTTDSAADAGLPCPACGRPTLGEAEAYEVCAACGWEDDPVARDEPAYAGGANGISLEEARVNVERFGLAFPPSEVGGS